MTLDSKEKKKIYLKKLFKEKLNLSKRNSILLKEDCFFPF